MTPGGLELLSREMSSYDQVNVQVAVDALAEDGAGSLEIVELSMERGFRAGLAEIAGSGGDYGPMLSPGPVEYASVDVGDRVISCIRAALLLVAEGEDRLAVLLAPDEDSGIVVEAMATRRPYAEQWF